MKRWDIIILEDGEQQEVVHGLTQAQTITLMSLFERSGITAKAIEYDENREPTGESDIVNPGNQRQ